MVLLPPSFPLSLPAQLLWLLWSRASPSFAGKRSREETPPPFLFWTSLHPKNRTHPSICKVFPNFSTEFRRLLCNFASGGSSHHHLQHPHHLIQPVFSLFTVSLTAFISFHHHRWAWSDWVTSVFHMLCVRSLSVTPWCCPAGLVKILSFSAPTYK